MSATPVEGLQRERTLLSWSRTMLNLVVVAALVLRQIGAPYIRIWHVPGIIIILIAVWLSITTDARYQRHRKSRMVGFDIHLFILWLSTIFMGIGGMVSIVLHLGET